MDWAHDQVGNLVHASDKFLFSYGFTCPTCGEPVRRRAGLERRPHFAHYSFSAKPDCEDYHPSTGEALSIATRVWEQERRPVTLEALSLRGGVFLERSEGGRFSLLLKLPRLRADADISGQLQVQSELGVRNYSAAQLRRPQFVPVVPHLPLVQVTATGDLAGAVPAIEDDISLFRASGNVFRAGNESGRLLAPEEPLEWGESYRLLTQRPLVPAPSELACVLVAQGGTRGWFVYEFELPTPNEDDHPSRQDVISRFLGRAIRGKSPRVFLVDPPAHHIDPDGTCVYPAFPNRLLLRRNGHCELRIDGDGRIEDTIIEERGEWIEISGLGQGEIIILADKRVQVTARVDECHLFRPSGVQLLAGESCWELFETELSDELERYQFQALTIQCPSSRVADEVQLRKEQWIQRGAHYDLRAPVSHLELDAGNFGSIAWPRVVSNDIPQETLVQGVQDHAAEVWMKGLVARAAAGNATLYLTNPTLIARHLPWLYPYFRVVQRAGRATP